jgi:lysophospholipase L1-like esterase
MGNRIRLGEIARHVVLLGVGLLIGALCSELLARGYARLGGEMGRSLADRDPMAVLYEPYGTYGYRQKPNRFQRFENGTRSNWNELGYRGPVVERAIPAGTFRVVLLGESTTEGWGVDDHETIDAHMRELLRERYPGVRSEVVNLALGGYDSYQIYERMKGDGVNFSPDVVIINSGVNDVRNAQFSDLANPDPRTLIWEENMRRMREEAAQGGPGLWTRVLHYSYAARLPGFYRENLNFKAVTARTRELTPHPDAVDYFEMNIRRTAELVSGVHADLILSTPPSSLRTRYAPSDFSERGYWVVDAATTQDYRDLLAARLAKIASDLTERGRPVAHVAAQLPPEDLIDDCHLTSSGNRAVARAFVAALVPHIARRFPSAVAAGAPTR